METLIQSYLKDLDNNFDRLCTVTEYSDSGFIGFKITYMSKGFSSPHLDFLSYRELLEYMWEKMDDK